MLDFTFKDLEKIEKQLKSGELKPTDLVGDNFTILHTVIKSDTVNRIKEMYLRNFIKLGCEVDVYAWSSTPISLASNLDSKSLIDIMLPYHEIGHRSDLDILKSAANSLDVGMFTHILKSNRVDTNTTQMRGSHILHHLSDIPSYSGLIKQIWKYSPGTIPNPIHRKGYSPLTHAINDGEDENILAMLDNEYAKIFGKLRYPETVIDFEIVDRYDGEFYEDFPTMIEYASNNGKEHLLPESVRDLFIF